MNSGSQLSRMLYQSYLVSGSQLSRLLSSDAGTLGWSDPVSHDCGSFVECGPTIMPHSPAKSIFRLHVISSVHTHKDMPPMPTVSRNLCFFCFFLFFSVFLVFFAFCLFRPLWPILAYLGILWPIVALWWCENTARGKHCKTLQGKQCKTHGRTASFSVNIICNNYMFCHSEFLSQCVFFNTHTNHSCHKEHTHTRHHALHVKKGAYKLRSCFKHYTVEYVEGTCQRW